ncbi:hypothetical protein BGZ65_003352, partial [Modicella reniformis]
MSSTNSARTPSFCRQGFPDSTHQHTQQEPLTNITAGNWNGSFMDTIQECIETDNPLDLGRTLLLSCKTYYDFQVENSHGNVDRLQQVIDHGLDSLQDPTTLVINALIIISAAAETTPTDRNVELAISQLLVGALKRFLVRSQ